LARLLGVAALIGIAVGLLFHGFEEVLQHLQRLLWVDLIGGSAR